MTDTFKEEWMTDPEGHQFYTRTYAAPAVPSAIILFVHGFAEHIGQYEHIHSKYPTRNITLFTFDQRGYGRTALDVAHRSKDSAYGKTNWTWQMGDIEHFATYLAKEHPGVPLFLMGHSMVRFIISHENSRSWIPALIHEVSTGRWARTSLLHSSFCTTVRGGCQVILRRHRLQSFPHLDDPQAEAVTMDRS